MSYKKNCASDLGFKFKFFHNKRHTTYLGFLKVQLNKEKERKKKLENDSKAKDHQIQGSQTRIERIEFMIKEELNKFNYL